MGVCKNCGNKLEDTDRYCTLCGSENEDYKDPDQTAAQEGRQDSSEPNEAERGISETHQAETQENSGTLEENGLNRLLHKMVEFTIPRRALGIGIAAVVIIIIAALYLLVFRRPTVNLDDYLEIKSSGYNGYGIVSASLDTETLAYDNYDIFGVSEDSEEDQISFQELLILEEYFSELDSGDFDKSSELTNGDTVTYSWNLSDSLVDEFEDQYKCRLNYNDISYEVSGLDDITEVDPFDENFFSIRFEGKAPDAKAYAENTKYTAIQYGISPEFGLSNGDVVTVTASMDGDVSTYGYTITEASKEFTVDGLDSYVTDLSQIPEDYLATMESQAQDKMASAVALWKYPEWYQSMEYVGSYLAYEKSTDHLWINGKNILFMVFQVTADSPEGTITYYTYARYDNIMLYSDGTCYTDLSSCDLADGYGEDFKVGDYEYDGFQDLDSLYNTTISQYLADYTITDNINK